VHRNVAAHVLNGGIITMIPRYDHSAMVFAKQAPRNISAAGCGADQADSLGHAAFGQRYRYTSLEYVVNGCDQAFGNECTDGCM
jgi:hypothetical protein